MKERGEKDKGKKWIRKKCYWSVAHSAGNDKIATAPEKVRRVYLNPND